MLPLRGIKTSRTPRSISSLNCGRLCLRTGTIKDDDGEDVEGEERVRPEEQVAQVRPCDAVREAWCCLILDNPSCKIDCKNASPQRMKGYSFLYRGRQLPEIFHSHLNLHTVQCTAATELSRPFQLLQGFSALFHLLIVNLQKNQIVLCWLKTLCSYTSILFTFFKTLPDTIWNINHFGKMKESFCDKIQFLFTRINHFRLEV